MKLQTSYKMNVPKNHFVYEEARPCCEGCEMDDPSQMHHDCRKKYGSVTMRKQKKFTQYSFEDPSVNHLVTLASSLKITTTTTTI